MIFFEKEYNGFEDIYDLERDVMEALDSRFNEKAKVIPAEFQGTIKVVMTYEE
jgi:hypothetical protein